MIPQQFYPSDMRGLSLKDLGLVMPKPSDEITTVVIPTPRGWKCRRKNCHLDVRHRHSVWKSLTK